jgi:hypothetical protein
MVAAENFAIDAGHFLCRLQGFGEIASATEFERLRAQLIVLLQSSLLLRSQPLDVGSSRALWPGRERGRLNYQDKE